MSSPFSVCASLARASMLVGGGGCSNEQSCLMIYQVGVGELHVESRFLLGWLCLVTWL